MPYTRLTVTDKRTDEVISDLYRIINQLRNDISKLTTGEGTGPVFNLPYGWKIECSPTALKITQYGVDKGLEL